MSSTTTNHPGRAQRFEGVVLVLIVIAVGTAAGAASFTHVKDWTLDNSPTGTGAWFGWANAVISELVPIAALLTIRRRKRTGGPILYPMALLVLAAGLSLAAQLGVAVGEVGPSGWLLSAVPALAFMALVKLVLAPVKTSTSDATTVHEANSTEDAPHASTVATEPEPALVPAATPVSAFTPDVPMHLLPTARYAMVNHRQTTGQPITAAELGARLSISPDIAGQLLTELGEPATPNMPALPARVNGARLPADH
ncbi:hypothetical protein [Phytohabitans rumicis]|uniref:DUF2637 domain-containing protein n=1 Tax=Phytohabitans rumicis TaxID=1076125 RepID=A0A6V8KRV1_9ACTN|nr:hypothetical protein [Phytohabitans rumicis]GFJ87852.1 hypothetical protein Prum_014940 [Phytohabitans rumicis]